MNADAPPGIKAVLLDLGGVLLRIHFDRTVTHWARAAGLPADAIADRFALDDAYARHERGEFSFTDYAQHIRETLGIALDDDTILRGWNQVLGEAMPGAVELVSAIAARYPVCLFSNSNAAHYACWSRDQRELLSAFRRVFVSHELGLRKPDPEAFFQVVSQMDVDPAAVAFFDDLDENVEAARRAGLMAFTVKGPLEVAATLGLTLPG
jgi:putative hydrolase of the HAD superfamily